MISVKDKATPRIIGELAGTDEHTMSCILDCRWAYGSDGAIVDLRKPRAPKLAGSWLQGMPTDGAHDVTEVSPGLVVTSSQPILFLDARRDPKHPLLLASGGNDDGRFIHGNVWPRGGRDKFLLVGGETGGPTDCAGEEEAAFMTWRTRGWASSHTFRMIDQFRVKSGLASDGGAAAGTYCAHWFDTHPTYRNGGLVAMSWYEYGTRFLKVSDRGRIREVGYFLPLNGSASAAYWITPRVLYVADYNRGLDILRFTGNG